PPAPAAPTQPATAKPTWQVVEQARAAKGPQGPTAEDRSYAEWFAWAKRGGAPASACHAAAQGAFKASAAALPARPRARADAHLVRERVRGEALTLVLNGDVFDLDAPRVVNSKSVFHDHPRDAVHAVPSMRAILDDHPLFVDA